MVAPVDPSDPLRVFFFIERPELLTTKGGKKRKKREKHKKKWCVVTALPNLLSFSPAVSFLRHTEVTLFLCFGGVHLQLNSSFIGALTSTEDSPLISRCCPLVLQKMLARYSWCATHLGIFFSFFFGLNLPLVIAPKLALTLDFLLSV